MEEFPKAALGNLQSLTLSVDADIRVCPAVGRVEEVRLVDQLEKNVCRIDPPLAATTMPGYRLVELADGYTYVLQLGS